MPCAVDIELTLPRFPAENKWFSPSKYSVLGPVRCMYLALYDRATPRAANVDGLLALKNPESYAWFGLTNALHNIDKMDWSTGEARAAGSQYKGVWTSNNDYFGDILVPFDNIPEDPECEDEAPEQEGASGPVGYTYVPMADSSDSGNEVMPGDTSSSEEESVYTDGAESGQ